MNLYSPHDFKNASEEERRIMLRDEYLADKMNQSQLEEEYERVIDLLNNHDKNIKDLKDCVIWLSQKHIPSFNPKYKLSSEYLMFCKYSIFTAKYDGQMHNFKFDYIHKAWYESKDGKYFEVKLQSLPDLMIHKRTEIDKELLKDYLS